MVNFGASPNKCGSATSPASILWSERNGSNDCFKVWSTWGPSMTSSQKQYEPMARRASAERAPGLRTAAADVDGAWGEGASPAAE